jgi:hypothetical protein
LTSALEDNQGQSARVMKDQGPELAASSVVAGHFSDALEKFAESVTSDRIDLATITQFMGQRSIAASLLILALPMVVPIPVPGPSIVFGVPLILVSAQLFFRRRYLWLPKRLARYSVSQRDFVTFAKRAAPMLRALERVVRPRIRWMSAEWSVVPVGAVCFILATVITLPMPFGHVAPGIAICVLALGLLERDGLVIGFGFIAAVLAVAVVAFASTSLFKIFRAWTLPPWF